MKRPSSSGWTPRTKVHHVARNAMGGFPSDFLLSEIREHADRGERVRVCRPGFRSYDIVRNGSEFLVLPVVGNLTPVGTFANICTAVLAGDRYIEAVRRGKFDAEDDDGGDWPRGAA